MFLMLAALVAQPATPPKPPEQRRTVIIRKLGPDGKVSEQRLEGAEAERLAAQAQHCDAARTFSSEVDRTVDGKREVSRIKVCAQGGESPAQWQQALRTTREKVKSDPRLSAESKARIVAELDAAIAKAGAR